MWEEVIDILQSGDFIRNSLLILVGGIITGIVIPIVKSITDTSKFKKQKKFEAKIKQQDITIKSQTQFIAAFSKIAWEYQLMICKVSYNKLFKEKYYDEASKDYDAKSWNLLSQLRSLAGEARWFTSADAYEMLIAFDDYLIYADDDLSIIKKEIDRNKWKKYHENYITDSRAIIDNLIVILTNDYSLNDVNIQESKDIIIKINEEKKKEWQNSTNEQSKRQS